MAEERRDIMDGVERIVCAMMEARDLAARGEIAEGCEVSIKGIRLFVGRYFGQIESIDLEKNTDDALRQSVPVLPYIVSFRVGRMPNWRRPILSIICTICLDDILSNLSTSQEKERYMLRDSRPGSRPSSEIGKEIRSLELRLARMDVNLDLYRFTELYYAVLSLSVEGRYSKSIRND